MTDDDIRQGFKTLLGYVPRASHPGVQQLGFRGYFKQKVEEMNARELFPFTSAVARGETEVGRKIEGVRKEAGKSETEGDPSSDVEEKRKGLRAGQEGLGNKEKRLRAVRVASPFRMI
jgi:hypothetical protein